tara:strand:+ start:43 stop:396 length:354 start_codon:yes stop_codon:yes gene_type:complete
MTDAESTFADRLSESERRESDQARWEQLEENFDKDDLCEMLVDTETKARLLRRGAGGVLDLTAQLECRLRVTDSLRDLRDKQSAEIKELKEEIKEFRLWVERDREEINRLREVIDRE